MVSLQLCKRHVGVYIFCSSTLFAAPRQGFRRVKGCCDPATPAGWGLFAGCPPATHPTAPFGRRLGRWALRWAAHGASRRVPGALRRRPRPSSAGSGLVERLRRTTAPAGKQSQKGGWGTGALALVRGPRNVGEVQQR